MTLSLNINFRFISRLIISLLLLYCLNAFINYKCVLYGNKIVKYIESEYSDNSDAKSDENTHNEGYFDHSHDRKSV